MWYGCFREDVITADGVRVRRLRTVRLGSVLEMGKREAERKLSERLAAINQGTHRPEVLIEFERFVLERWEPNTLPMLRFSTARNYRHLVRRHLNPFFGRMKLAEISPADVQMFLAEKSKRYAPKTVLELRNLLSKIFGTAERWGYRQSNPARGAQVPTLVDTRERIALTPEQVRKLLDELAEPFRTMVLLAVLSGLRRGELLGLRWGRVDFVEGSVTVAESNYEGHAGPPKTRASRRKVFVDSVVLDALRGIQPALVNSDALVFPSERGTALNPNNVLHRVLHPACKRAGIPEVGFHAFRYTFATWANADGESIKAVQAQMGHTDSRLTLGVYTQPMPEAQRQLARKVRGVLLPDAAKLPMEAEWSGGLPN
jgi:integrase